MCMLAIILSAISVYAQGETVNEKANVRDFTGIDVSSVFNVYLEKGPRQTVVLSYSSELEPFIQVEVKGGELVLSLNTEKMDRKLRSKVNRRGFNNGAGSYILEATVSLPEMVSLDVSGAAQVYSTGRFGSISNLSIDISGAGEVKGMEVKGERFEMDLSGAARLEMPYVDFSEVSIDASGASVLEMTGNIVDVMADLSGASNLTMSGTYGQYSLEGSGASRVVLTGEAKKFNLDVSGAVSLKSREFSVKEVYVSGSGASNVVVSPQEKITIDISGATSLSYAKGAEVDIVSISRGCHVDTF